MKPKLLVLELWGIGDLAIATPFIQAASEKYDVTLLAKPFAADLQKRFWPNVTVVPFSAPWTAFEGKYNFFQWPWRQMARVWKRLAGIHFEVGVSARWDPRDHFLLRLTGATRRYGFPRLRSQHYLTDCVELPEPTAHRYEYWRQMSQQLGVILPEKSALEFSKAEDSTRILLHSGAARLVRVWPLPRFKNLVGKLREAGYSVQVACDPDQRKWWIDSGEAEVATPRTISELLNLVEKCGLFIGNDSGPGHLSGISGCPTFTIFGPQLPEWFAPLHPRAEFVEGKACPYKPCFDYCRFPAPHCLLNVSEDEVWERVQRFVTRNFEIRALAAANGTARS